MPSCIRVLDGSGRTYARARTGNAAIRASSWRTDAGRKMSIPALAGIAALPWVAPDGDHSGLARRVVRGHGT